MQETLVSPLLQEIPHAEEQLSPCAATAEPTWLRARAPQHEKYTAMKSSPGVVQLEKSPLSNEDPAQPKINKKQKRFTSC